MGRTVPSFSMQLRQEVQGWRNFRAALLKREREDFDVMLDIAQLHNSNCMMACRTFTYEGMVMSVIFEHFIELNEIEENLVELRAKLEAPRI